MHGPAAAQRMVLTLIDIEPEADTWFPEWDEQEWSQTSERKFPSDDSNKLAYRIIELSRYCQLRPNPCSSRDIPHPNKQLSIKFSESTIVCAFAQSRGCAVAYFRTF